MWYNKFGDKMKQYKKNIAKTTFKVITLVVIAVVCCILIYYYA